MPVTTFDDEKDSVCTDMTEYSVVCNNCSKEEHENEQNGTLTYGCIDYKFCSDCYADEKANHPDFEEKDDENDDKNDKNDDDEDDENQKITLTYDELEYIKTNDDCEGLTFTEIIKLIENNKKNELIYDSCYKCGCTFATDEEYTECNQVHWGSYCHDCWDGICQKHNEIIDLVGDKSVDDFEVFRKILCKDAGRALRYFCA